MAGNVIGEKFFGEEFWNSLRWSVFLVSGVIWIESEDSCGFCVQISDSLLHDPSCSLEALYFSAQTIRTKVGWTATILFGELRRVLRPSMS